MLRSAYRTGRQLLSSEKYRTVRNSIIVCLFKTQKFVGVGVEVHSEYCIVRSENINGALTGMFVGKKRKV